MFWLLKKLLLSVFIIILVHQLVNYIKDKYTKPKIIDLVDNPEKRYKNILNTLQENSPPTPGHLTTSPHFTTSIANSHAVQNVAPSASLTTQYDDGADTTSIDNLVPINTDNNPDNNPNNNPNDENMVTMNNELQDYFNDLSKTKDKENTIIS